MTVANGESGRETMAMAMRNRGFTLLEVSVAVGILSLVLVAVAMTLRSTSRMAASESTRNEMERSSQHAIDVMGLELREAAASVVTIAADGSSIQFKIPVDLNGNGTVLNGTGSLEWGYLNAGVPTAGTITYKFVQNSTVGVSEVLNEATLGRGLNSDADKVDRFDHGHIVRITQATGGPAITGSTVSGRWIVQRNSNWGGDVSGDGLADPIFKLDAANNRVLVNLWTIQIDGENNAHLVNCNSSICLRNK